MVVNNIDIEDMINFQKIDFTILEGIYFNDGFNKNFSRVIVDLYAERMKFKNEKNGPAERLIKLILNSAYGKTAIWSGDNNIKIVDNDKLDNYIMKHCNSVIKSIPFEK